MNSILIILTETPSAGTFILFIICIIFIIIALIQLKKNGYIQQIDSKKINQYTNPDITNSNSNKDTFLYSDKLPLSKDPYTGPDYKNVYYKNESLEPFPTNRICPNCKDVRIWGQFSEDGETFYMCGNCRFFIVK